MKGKTPLIVAFVALFVALSGSAIAASLITGKQIKNGTITKKDISKGTVRSLRGLDGLDGIDGKAGPAGPAGAAGPAGPNWSLTPVGASYTIGAGVIDIYDVSCPAGLGIISGGWFTSSDGGAFVDKTYDGRSWSVGVDNYFGSISASVEVYAYCAPVPVAVRAAKVSGSRSADLAAERAKHEAG